MILRPLLLLTLAVSANLLCAGEFSLTHYTKIKNSSLQQIYSTTKNRCFSENIPLNGKLPVIVLDEDIYRHLNSTQTNIVLVGGNDRILPFVIRKLHQWKRSIQYTPVTGKISNFTIDRQRNEALIDYQISAQTPLFIGKLSLQPSGRKKFNKTITLEFDGQTQVKDLKFFNHHNIVDFFRQDFTFTPQHTKNIRIKIAPFAEKHTAAASLVRTGSKENFSETKILTEELSLHKITFYQADTAIYPAGELTGEKTFPFKTVAGRSGESKLEFTLGNYPVKELKVFSSTQNYYRQYTLEFQKKLPGGNLQTVKEFSGTLTPDFRLQFNDLRADKAVLTIKNQADAPLSNMNFNWLVPQIGLLIDPKEELEDLKVYYGGQVNKLPEFDFKYYVDKFNGKDYYFLQLGSESNNQKYKIAKQNFSNILKSLLSFIVAAAAIIIALASYKMLKKAPMQSGRLNE